MLLPKTSCGKPFARARLELGRRDLPNPVGGDSIATVTVPASARFGPLLTPDLLIPWGVVGGVRAP